MPAGGVSPATILTSFWRKKLGQEGSTSIPKPGQNKQQLKEQGLKVDIFCLTLDLFCFINLFYFFVCFVCLFGVLDLLFFPILFFWICYIVLFSTSRWGKTVGSFYPFRPSLFIFEKIATHQMSLFTLFTVPPVKQHPV